MEWEWILGPGEVVAVLAFGFAVWSFWRTRRLTELDERIKELELKERTDADVQVRIKTGVVATSFRKRRSKSWDAETVEHNGKILVFENHGRLSAYNVDAQFESLGQTNPKLERLAAVFPLHELPPGSDKEIHLTSAGPHSLPRTVWGFRVTWEWDNSDGTHSDRRSMEFR